MGIRGFFCQVGIRIQCGKWSRKYAGISRYDGSWRSYLTDISDTGDVWAIEKDPNGNIWFGFGRKGIYIYEKDTKSFKTINNSLPNHNILAIEFDHNGHAWIGTSDAGLIKITETDTAIYKFENNEIDLKSKRIWTILEDTSNNLWIGINCYQPKDWEW